VKYLSSHQWQKPSPQKFEKAEPDQAIEPAQIRAGVKAEKPIQTLP
jgi:hypothetical protein